MDQTLEGVPNDGVRRWRPGSACIRDVGAFAVANFPALGFPDMLANVLIRNAGERNAMRPTKIE